MEWIAGVLGDPWLLLLIVTTLAVGSFAKGITGIGLPIFAVPLLATIIGVEHAVVVLVLPSLVSNLWLLHTHRATAPQSKKLFIFLIFGAIGGAIGTWLLAVANERLLMLLLALWLAVYLYVLLTRSDYRLPRPRTLAPFFGLVAGTVQGATGVSAPIIAPFLTGIGLQRDAFVFAIALSFTVFSTAQIAAMGHYGLFTPSRLLEGLAALVPTMLALELGIRLGRRINAATFRRVLIAVFVVMEIRLVHEALTG